MPGAVAKDSIVQSAAQACMQSRSVRRRRAEDASPARHVTTLCQFVAAYLTQSTFTSNI